MSTERYKAAGIPQRFWGMSFTDFETYDEPVLEAALQASLDYLSELDEHMRQGRGLLFVGEPGYGKTLLACLVLMTILDSRSRVTGFYTTYSGYTKYLLNMMELRQAWDRYDDLDSFHQWARLSDRVKAMRNTFDFLALDDIGKEHTTNTRFAEDEFDFLLRRRFDMCLPSIGTSNVPIEQWSVNYSASMKSFVAEAFIIVPMGGISGYDYRRKKVAHGPG